MSASKHWEQDKDATLYVGNLDERAKEELVYELFSQVGRVSTVHAPLDRVSRTHQGYAFVEFINAEDADYAAKVMNGVKLYSRPLKVNKSNADKEKQADIGAELFIGNLDPLVDEKMLYDTFSRFGNLVANPKVARDEANLSKGYGFVSYDSFEASDKAIEIMHGNHFMNKEITVSYAFKKDGKGERHGDEAERRLAAEAREHNVEVPKQPLAPVLTAVPQATPAAAAATGFQNYQGAPQYNPAMPSYYNPQQPQAAQSYNYQQPTPQGFNQPAQPPATPAGLPPRPPQINAGYGGPQNFGQPPAGAPGFYAPGQGPPMPPGFGQGSPPPGIQFAPPAPPGGAPGFPQPYNMPPGYNPAAQSSRR